MAWQIRCHMRDPLDNNCTQKMVGPYDTQNLARWWAVAFAERGSISWHQGQADEELIPMHTILKMDIEEI